MNLVELINNLTPCVLRAGKRIMDIYQLDAKKDFKKDGSPVTEADKGAERIILKELKKLIPGIPVISEENVASHSKIPPTQFFLVDPLDGTKEFLKKDGLGSFTVNIGLIESNIPTMGIVFAPALGRLFYGCKSSGA